MHLLLRWGLNAVALWLTAQLGLGLAFGRPGLGPVLIAALVLGLVNAVVRPVMVILTLPLTLLTMGLFLLVVNALALAVVASLTSLTLSGFGGAILSALVLSIIGGVLGRLIRDDVRRPA